MHGIELLPAVRNILMFLCFSITSFSLGNLIRSFWAKRAPEYRVMYGALCVFGLQLMVFFDNEVPYVPRGIMFVGLPLFVLGFIGAVFIGREHRLSRLGTEAVKECVDSLPMGICCYFDDGQVKLANDTMIRLCVSITGHSLMDGVYFRKILEDYRKPGQSHIIVKSDDNSVFDFTESVIDYNGRKLREILAFNVTEVYKLTDELKEQEERVGALNTRLKEISEEAVKTAIEKEILTAKVRVHDDLGRVILLARRYLKTGAKTGDDMDKVATELKRQAILMLSESPDEWRRDYAYIFRTARLLGIRANIKGRFPKSGIAKRLAVSTLSCALLNTARHAGADSIYFTCAQVKDETSGKEHFELLVRDNGYFWVENVEEKGGLKSLRSEIEAEGGSLFIESGQGVSLKVLIPIED